MHQQDAGVVRMARTRNTSPRPSPLQRAAGFTLVEIAVVLVIVGLILGGVFKGQALIDGARVRSLANEVAGIRTAWYGFQDRYRSLPGDFANAATQIDSAAAAGNGNGRIEDGRERAAVWQQLALSGFISGSFDGRAGSSGSATDVECGPGTCPKNPFGGAYKISYASQAADARGAAHEIYTGDRIPVQILAELDRKLDDGLPDGGRLRVHRAFASACTRDGQWDVASAHASCAGVLRD